MNKLILSLKNMVQIPDFKQFMVTIFFLGVTASVYGPYISIFGLQEMQMTPALFSLYYSLSTIFGIVLNLALGRLSDVVRSRKLIIFAVLLSGAVGYAILAFSRNYSVVLISSCLFVALSNAAFPQLFAFAKETLGHDSQETNTSVIGTLRSFYSIGWVIGPLLGSLVFLYYGFTWLYLFVAVLFLMLMVILKSGKLHENDNKARPKKKAVVMSRKIFLSVVSFIFIFTASGISMISLPLLITEELHISKAYIGVLYSAASFTEIPCMMFFGYVAGKVNKSRLVAAGIAAALLYYFGMMLASQMWQLFCLQILSGIAISLIMGLGISYFQDLISDQPGTTTALYTTTNRLGSVTAGFLTGYLYQWYNYRVTFLVCGIMAICSLVFLFISNINSAALKQNESNSM
ncbi:sugar efflux transporter [Paenibacillus sp. M1]|uniref:Sugar efflux transporter n=1 Tax=Paenibacillus haidiansis TaxID=1574488 RepID=A0ABU7VVD8_9BACL